MCVIRVSRIAFPPFPPVFEVGDSWNNPLARVVLVECLAPIAARVASPASREVEWSGRRRRRRRRLPCRWLLRKEEGSAQRGEKERRGETRFSSLLFSLLLFSFRQTLLGAQSERTWVRGEEKDT